MSHNEHQSKRLAYLLRHSSLPDIHGWMPLADLITRHGFTAELLKDIVYNDEFGRYEFSSDRSAVKARYGHTNHVSIKLPPAIPPKRLYHGTSEKAVERILSEGIKRMQRQYVHLSETMEKATRVGKRHGKPVVMAIDTEAMYRDGYTFHFIVQDVWLTSYIEPRYISIVTDDEKSTSPLCES